MSEDDDVSSTAADLDPEEDALEIELMLEPEDGLNGVYPQ